MNSYVIIHNVTGMYVTQPGSEHSYSKKLENAWLFSSKDAAEKEWCSGSERIVKLDTLLRPLI